MARSWASRSARRAASSCSLWWLLLLLLEELLPGDDISLPEFDIAAGDDGSLADAGCSLGLSVSVSDCAGVVDGALWPFMKNWTFPEELGLSDLGVSLGCCSTR